MAHFTPPTDEMLNLVAELRADGVNWEAISRRVNRTPRTLRRWRLKYLDRWNVIQQQAERHVASDAECESVLVLRKLLRSTEEKIRWHAAKSLLALRVDLGKLDLKMPPAANPLPHNSELVRLFTFLDGHPDAELQTIAELAPLPAPETVRVGSGDPDCKA